MGEELRILTSQTFVRDKCPGLALVSPFLSGSDIEMLEESGALELGVFIPTSAIGWGSL